MNRTHSQIHQASTDSEGPSKDSKRKPTDTKEILFLSSGLLALMFGIGGLLMYSEEEPLPTAAIPTADRVEVATTLATTSFAPPPSVQVAPPPETLEDPAPPSLTKTMADPEPQDTTIYFGVNQVALTQEAKDHLTQHVQNIPSHGKGTLHVKGYTDSQGSSSYNRRLGLKRAQAVKTYLVSLGFPEEHIIATSFGMDGAVCQDQNPACFTQNRRAHLAFIPTSFTAENEEPLAQGPPIQNASLEAKALSVSQDSPSSDATVESLSSEDLSAELISADPLMTAESQP